MSVLLDIVYAAGLVATSPFWLYRMIRHGRYRRGIAQKFGAAPIRYGLQPVIWIHGVSLGEVNAARTLVAEIHRQLPDYRVVVSSSTDTGMAAAQRLYVPDHAVFAWPLDFSAAVARALSRVRPSLVIMMEGEVWPNFLAACNKRNIPAVVVNARMSADKGYPRYKRLGVFATRLFNRLTAIGAQDESYAERFRSLGIASQKIHVTGMLKFDTAEAADSVPGQETLAAALGIAEGDQLIVAGGTGMVEAQMLAIFKDIRSRHPKARLAIVPRKPERFDEVARLIESAGFALIRRSKCGMGVPSMSDTGGTPVPRLGPQAGPPNDAVILGDTMGELRKFYGLATAVFVGRSLAPMGGSDMIESAALGKATAFGPHTFNFPQADALAAHGCARVADATALAKQLDAWLADPASGAKAGKTAQDYVRSQQGATLHNIEMICRILGREPAAAPGAIATESLKAR